MQTTTTVPLSKLGQVWMGWKQQQRCCYLKLIRFEWDGNDDSGVTIWNWSDLIAIETTTAVAAIWNWSCLNGMETTTAVPLSKMGHVWMGWKRQQRCRYLKLVTFEWDGNDNSGGRYLKLVRFKWGGNDNSGAAIQNGSGLNGMKTTTAVPQTEIEEVETGWATRVNGRAATQSSPATVTTKAATLKSTMQEETNVGITSVGALQTSTELDIKQSYIDKFCSRTHEWITERFGQQVDTGTERGSA